MVERVMRAMLSKQKTEERMQTICKTYLLLEGEATARQLYEFILFNNFGVDITYNQVVNYLRNNVYKSSNRESGCLRNCYNYREVGQVRVYRIQE